jgi:eukaryotic translation initiation factor 2-alpha kinase 4
MEYCQETLREAIDRNIFDEDAAFIYFRQMVEGLDYLHKNGIIHRDLKPVSH